MKLGRALAKNPRREEEEGAVSLLTLGAVGHLKCCPWRGFGLRFAKERGPRLPFAHERLRRVALELEGIEGSRGLPHGSDRLRQGIPG